MQLRGDGLWGVPHLQCRFGTVAVEARVTAEWRDDGGGARRLLTLHCEPTPAAAAAGSVPLEVTMNGPTPTLTPTPTPTLTPTLTLSR